MKISRAKEEKIKEGIIHLLFESSPKALFTAAIAQHLARDEEYVKKLLFDLEQSNLVIPVRKNPKGKIYSRRTRWLLDTKVYDAYKSLNVKHNDTRIA